MDDENPSLVNDFCKQFENLDFTDSVLICDNKEFPVHRFVLSARSEVFKAAFAHNETEEGKTGQIVIEDLKPSTLQALIRYIALKSKGKGLLIANHFVEVRIETFLSS